MIQFVQEHSAVVVGLVVASLDFAFAVSPKLAGNGIVHAIYVFFKGKQTPTTGA